MATALPRVRLRFEAVHHGVVVLTGDDVDDVLARALDYLRARVPAASRHGARLRILYGMVITLRVVDAAGQPIPVEWLTIYAVFARGAGGSR